ncbi:MAG TPA: PilZ domain-containing protein [Nitrospiraceae bacterium]|nr:PilZ domain-containing protein [Nitrospiraceae bacterium]
MEQRKNLRFHAQFRSSFSSVAMVGGEGSLMDLSIRGCRIESLTDVRPGATLEVRVEAIEGEPPIQIQAAIVRWSRERQFGLEFEVIAPTEWAHLQDIVKQIELEPYQRERQAADAPGSA